MTVLVGVIVSIALSIVCFISTENIISALIIGGVSLLYFELYVNGVIKTKNEKINRFQSCYQFVNNFLIALSIKGHISGALASALESQNEETIDMLKSVDSKDPMEKIKYLQTFFKFDIFSLFIDLIDLYNDEGGDVIQMSHYLLNQLRESEEYIVGVERMNKNSLIEFTILWIFSLSILAVLKFSLSDFFAYVIRSTFYQISVVAVLVFFLISVHIAIVKVTSINIKGWN